MAIGLENIIIWLRAIHLGRKPVSGGRPPSERIVRERMVDREVREVDHIWAIWLVLCSILNIVNIRAV